PVAHLGAPDLDRPNPGLDRALRSMAVTHDAVAAIGQFSALPLGNERVGLRDQHLGEHSAGAFTRDFGQGVVASFRLTGRNDGGLSRHGVSLLSGGSRRLDPRLDTPPSIKRRHPDSRTARLYYVRASSCPSKGKASPTRRGTAEKSEQPKRNKDEGQLARFRKTALDHTQYRPSPWLRRRWLARRNLGLQEVQGSSEVSYH